MRPQNINEVSNSATTKVLKKVAPDEVDAFQAYTIRNLDNKLSIGPDRAVQTHEHYRRPHY